MGKKPKKGKFKYNLTSVLKVRAIRETQEKEKFAETQKKLKEEKKKEEEIKNSYKSAQLALRSEFEEDSIDFSQIFLRQNQVENLKEEVDIQKEIAKKAELLNEEQRKKLIKSVQDKEIIEKDKENKFAQWKDLMNKEESKFMDEIAGIRFNRNKRKD